MAKMAEKITGNHKKLKIMETNFVIFFLKWRWGWRKTLGNICLRKTILLITPSLGFKGSFNFLTIRVVVFIWGTRAVEAQFQIEAPDPYPLLKLRTDLGTLVVLSASNFITFISVCGIFICNNWQTFSLTTF